MTDDSTSHRVFRINELTRFIASRLIPISRKSAVNLACVCRYLEEPVLSTLWETHESLDTLLQVLPEGYWEFKPWVHDKGAVRDLALPHWRNRTLKFRATFSSRSRGIHRRGLGVESGAMRRGCVGSAWVNCCRCLGMTFSANCASIHQSLASGSRPCGI